MTTSALEYNCLFCDNGIAEDDPERLDLIVKRPELEDLRKAVWYACHRSCLGRAEGHLGRYA